MNIEIKKSKDSETSYGRGPDNNYTPAQYAIIKNGAKVGTIMSHLLHYGVRANWDIVGIDYKVIKTFYHGSRHGTPFNLAKQFARDYFSG